MKRITLDFIFGLSSLIGLIITLVVTGVSILGGEDTLGIGALGIICALAATNVFLSVILASQSKKISALDLINIKRYLSGLRDKRRIKESREIAHAISKAAHDINDQMRDRIVEIFNINSELSSSSGEGLFHQRSYIDGMLKSVRRKNELFHLFVVNNVRDVFNVISKDECSVCIKILALDDIDNKGSSQDILVRTYMRDTNSYRSRKRSDDKIFEYSYYENTAFKEILSADNDSSYYVSDDLLSENTYVNLNVNWKKSYNATLVAPIRYALGQPATDYAVLGFVCIDNKKGGLSDGYCIDFLASVSDLLYSHFVLLNGLFDEFENYIERLESEKNQPNLG